jgi:hypothetical protein
LDYGVVLGGKGVRWRFREGCLLLLFGRKVLLGWYLS